MNAGTWKQVKDIFAEVVDLDACERLDRITAICNGDQEVRSQVEALLASNDEVENFIEDPAFTLPGALSAESDPAENKLIGRYRILREIGRGGMGTVYLAERSDGEFEHEVAIKVVSSAFLGRENLRRFRRERQILAGLSHPNIARLLDGGVTDEGLPYLVMEYVEGDQLVAYAGMNRLTVVDRLRLFLKICRAFAHAHGNLIVHRDVKPSNILVTVEGEPKLLDFGLAKILDIERDEIRTATNFRALTPAYASPEQIRGDAITTASDIYSLGVVLYELLTGQRPFNFESMTLEKMIAAAAVSAPTLPSEALARARDDKTRSRAAGDETMSLAEVPILPSQLKGDIDKIVLMAMRHEPERRYHTVEQLADDVERHLDGLPITAAEDSFVYRARKFIGRNRVAVAAASMIVVLLIAGILTTAWQARRARIEQAKAEQTKKFLEQTLNSSNPLLTRDQSHEATLTDVLNEAARRLDDGEFAGQPDVRAELELIIGNAYNAHGEYQLAIQHIGKYVELESDYYGEGHPKTLVAMSRWANLLFFKGDLAEADAIYRRVVPPIRLEQAKGNVDAADLANALNDWAYLCRTRGDSAEAETLFREALALDPQLSNDEWRQVNGTTRSTLASVLSDQGKFDEALTVARDAVEEYRNKNETASANFGFALTILGGLLTEKGDMDEANAALREGESIIRKRLAPSSLWLGDNLRDQSIAFYQQGRYAEALDASAEALKIYREMFGTHYDHYPTALMIRGLSLARTGRGAEGETTLREAVRIRTDSLPPDHYWIALAKGALGEGLVLQNKFQEAEPLLLESFKTLETSQGVQNPRTELAARRLVMLYQNWHRPEDGARYLAVLTH